MTTEPKYTDALTDEQCVEIRQRLPLGCAGYISGEAIRYALAPLLTERQAAMQGQGGEAFTVPVAYLAENANEAFIFFANDHESLDAYTADGFSITCLVRGLTQAPEQPPRPVRSVSDDECPACHKNWGEHRFGYSASRCTMKKQQPPVKIVSNEDVEAALKVWNDAPALGREEDDAYAMRAVLAHFAAIAQEKQS